MISLARRDLTCYELETRLQEKGYLKPEVRDVLEKAEKLGYLDDERLALAVAQSRLKRYSRRRVRQDMQNRGFAAPVIEQALAAAYSSSAELEQCLLLAKRWRLQDEERWEQRNGTKSSSFENKNGKFSSRELALRQKIAQKLGQRGYSAEMVRTVLERFFEQMEN